MKVILLYHYFAHYREPVLRELARSDVHEYEFITGDKSNHQGMNPLLELNLGAGGDVKFEVLQNIWIKGKALWQRGILSKLMFGDYDVFVCLGNVNIISNWVACALCRIRGKRVLMWTHGLYGGESGLVRVLRCLHYRMASGLLLYGERAFHLLQGRGFNASDLYVVANSLDVDRQNILYAEMCSGITDFPGAVSFEAKDSPTLLFIGRITKQKKIHLLLEAASMLRERGKAVNVLIVGDGAELESLKSLAGRLNLLPNVCFYGPSFDEVENAKLIYRSDMCVAPGEVGLTAMHSLVYGTPVVTHGDFSKQGPEYEAVVSGRSGLFFREGDILDLTDKIGDWFDGGKCRDEVRADCREIILKKYNPSYQREVIEKAIGGHYCD